jgi:hypothetical protein
LKINKRFLAVGLLLTLAIAAVAPATAQENQTEYTQTASVTVNFVEQINFTIVDTTPSGISFGNRNPETYNAPEVSQNGTTPALTLTVHSDTNVPCNVLLKGSGPFSDGKGNSIALANATWHTGNITSEASSMSTTYSLVGDSTVGITHNYKVWHWLTIPKDQVDGTYQTTFYYRAERKTQ